MIKRRYWCAGGHKPIHERQTERRGQLFSCAKNKQGLEVAKEKKSDVIRVKWMPSFWNVAK